MAREPMRLLRSARRRAVEAARYALGACLMAETAAADRITAIDDEARRDRGAHAALTEAHWFQDMFVRRIDAVQAERRIAEAAFAAAQAGSAAARADVVVARTAAEAVETLIAERAAADEMVANRTEQRTLDDMTRVRFDSGDGGSAGRLR
jgi:hypothetical protein